MNALDFEFEGKKYLGFATGINQKRFAHSDTIRLKKIPGILIDSRGTVTELPIERFVEHNDEMIALIPHVNGIMDFDSLNPDTGSIKKLIHLGEILKKYDFPLKTIIPEAIKWTSDGGILLFPPALVSWLTGLQDEDTEENGMQLHHPDLEGEDGWSFSLAVLIYRTITGKDPYGIEQGENRRERIRKNAFTPIEAVIPEIKETVSGFINNALKGISRKQPDLKEWYNFILSWEKEGLTEELSEEERKHRLAQAGLKNKYIDKKVSISRWFRKNGWKYTGALIVLIIVSFVAAPPVKKALSPPVTAGLNPMEVAKLYYQAINNMDMETMADCTAEKAGKNDINFVTTIYVTSRTRKAYEHINGPVPADKWVEQGKPELPEDSWPWGCSDLKLTALQENLIKAEYLFWMPPEQDKKTGKIINRTDILTFRQGKKAWEIISINRSESFQTD